MSPPPPKTTSALLLQAQMALKMSQTAFGQLLGVSRRTIIRWHGNHLNLPVHHQATLTRLVHAQDPALASALATAFGGTLESLGVVTPAAPLPAYRDLADVIVCAAAEAAGLAPQAIRPALVAAFDRAASVGLTIADVQKGLAPLRPRKG